MEKAYYVYRHVRLDTGRPFYYGKGRDVRAWSKGNRNQYWHNIVKSAGYRVELLWINLTEDEALAKEMLLIKVNRVFGFAEANLTSGGESPKHSELTKKKISEIVRKQFENGRHIRREPLTEEQKKKMSLARMGTPGIRGEKSHLFGKTGDQNLFYGKKHTEETLAKIKKRVIDTACGFVWDSCKEASDVYSINYTQLSCMLAGSRKNRTTLRYLDA